MKNDEASDGKEDGTVVGVEASDSRGKEGRSNYASVADERSGDGACGSD